jgi:hypothetical protein
MGRGVPPGAIEQQHGVGAVLDMPADFIDVQLHGKGIGIGQRQTGALALGRTDGAEQIGILIALVSRLPGTGSALGPETDDAIFLADAGLVLEPDLDRPTLGKMTSMGLQRPWEVFLNAAMTSAS